MATTEKFSAKEAAIQIGTDARTLRKFIRGAKDLPIEPVGQGNRYEFTKVEIKALKKAFLAWGGGKSPKVSDKKKTKDKDPIMDMTQEELDALGDAIGDQDEIDRTIEEVDLDADDEPALEDLEPTDEDLELDEDDLDED